VDGLDIGRGAEGEGKLDGGARHSDWIVKLRLEKLPKLIDEGVW
jgi:hypothetical protein